MSDVESVKNVHGDEGDYNIVTSDDDESDSVPTKDIDTRPSSSQIVQPGTSKGTMKEHKGFFRPRVNLYTSDSDSDDDEPATNLSTINQDLIHSSDNLMEDSEADGSVHSGSVKTSIAAVKTNSRRLSVEADDIAVIWTI